MIEAHTLDAWTRESSRYAVAFRNATILGGFAAPLFLWLAGIGVVLSAGRTAERTGSRAAAVEAACRRGLEIFVLAFLFRVQAFVLSPGSHPVTLFRVDILNVMGPAMAVAGLVWACSGTTTGRVVAFGTAAIAATMVTPVVRASSAVDALPTWLQWYLRPAGEHTTFTLLPWAGFVFAGGATGVLIAAARDVTSERRLQIAIAIAGALLIALGFYTAARPSIYRNAFFWTSSPTWFAIRVGLLMLALAALAFVERLATRAGSSTMDWWRTPLGTLGRASLFVYWIHVELVYGYASWVIHRSLPLWGTAIAYAVFVVLMYHVVVLRNRYFAGGFRLARAAVPARQNAIR